MPYKIAIASSDGKFVNQHFGRAQKFLIVELKDDGSYTFLETRKNKPACTVEDHDSTIEDSLELISDCDGVLVSQVGPGAADRLIERGIQPIIIPLLIDDALKKVYELIQQEK
ncbi:NifB/NifX family molybdenum-iron cluster-binding protein [Methanobacterium oryzae]|uniref:NifB/NifX family molybdenum-iron cluster-binding protein n=1 Tax=Methanobacterium oryzae TaxID=69540 RepID=UPI003D1EC908